MQGTSVQLLINVNKQSSHHVAAMHLDMETWSRQSASKKVQTEQGKER